MQHSSVAYSEIDLGNRLDAEYFQPKYLHIEKKLLQHKSEPLKNYCSIVGSAFYPAATHLYESGDLPFIRCVDCISYPTITSRQNDLFERLPSDFVDEHKNIKRLKKGEIVITKVGTPCYTSIIYDLSDVALSRTVLGLKEIKGIHPYYLVVYLRSKYGFLQLLRERELTIQFQLTLGRVGDILIYKPSDHSLEKIIAKCFNLYEQISKKSESLFNEAGNVLLSELGLSNWQPNHQLTFIKNYSDTKIAGRIDAEYYQPKYEEIVKVIQKYSDGWDMLGNLVAINSCTIVPEKTQKYKYIELSNIAGNGEVIDCMVEEGQNLPSRARRKISAGDVIVSSIEGSLSSIALIEEEYNQALCSTGFYVINSEFFNSETLLILLKSLVGQLQLKKGCSGTILTAINEDKFGKIVLPKVSKYKQTQIREKITESSKLRKQSKHLLECAKRAVEMAIEQDEQTAINWLQKEMKAVNAG